MRPALDAGLLRKVYDRVARRYDRQHALVTACSDQRGRVLLVRKAVVEGDRVLDCGAGTGSTGLLAAREVGTSGRVTLVDMSEGMLAVARSRSAQERMRDRVEFVTGDMLELPFGDGVFDVVLSTYSMCPVHDPAQAATEAFRVTRPGGRIGVAHTSIPQGAVVQWLADRVENIAWKFPSVSLGCRAVNVLPTFEGLGCTVVFVARIGVPLWPFQVLILKKPKSCA